MVNCWSQPLEASAWRWKISAVPERDQYASALLPSKVSCRTFRRCCSVSSAAMAIAPVPVRSGVAGAGGVWARAEMAVAAIDPAVTASVTDQRSGEIFVSRARVAREGYPGSRALTTREITDAVP